MPHTSRTMHHVARSTPSITLPLGNTHTCAFSNYPCSTNARARYATLLGSDDEHFDAQYLVRFQSREHSLTLRSHDALKGLHFNDDGRRMFYAHGHLSNVQLDAVRQLTGVDYVSHNKVMQFSQTSTTDTNPGSWGLDRIDQRQAPLDGVYDWSTSNSGAGVSVFVVDSGVRTSHPGFSGRAKFFADCVLDGEGVCTNHTDTEDLFGHGTMVAGVVVSQTHGVSRDAEVLSIRIGNIFVSWIAAVNGIVEAIKYADAHPNRRFVMNLSIGIPVGDNDITTDDAVRDATDAGIVVVIASGNSPSLSSCDITPARVAEAITVGSSNIHDEVSEFSSSGPCVDLHAPGSDIVTLNKNYEQGNTVSTSGTSFAAPHVAGVAAMWLSANPLLTPEQVKQAILNSATEGALDMSPAVYATSNLLLYSGDIGESATTTPTIPPTQPPRPCTPSTPWTKCCGGILAPDRNCRCDAGGWLCP